MSKPEQLRSFKCLDCGTHAKLKRSHTNALQLRCECADEKVRYLKVASALPENWIEE